MRVDSQRLVSWVVRLAWIALPFTVGPPLADALDAASRPVQLVASSGLWAGWAVGVVAVLVPHPLSLTALRIVAPASVVAVVAAAAADHASPLALGWATVTAAWAFAPSFGLACVNGPAYPNERRFLLRVPGALLVGPLALAWALTVAGLAAGPLLLAARQWVAGAIAFVVGVPVAVVLVRSMHALSRRWAVFVPAGLVLHDPLTLADPVLFPRQTVEVLRPAPGGQRLARPHPTGARAGARAPAAGQGRAHPRTTGCARRRAGPHHPPAVHAHAAGRGARAGAHAADQDELTGARRRRRRETATLRITATSTTASAIAA